jgi:drug/metabolite transporter (DMT)-like permease
MHSLQTLGLQLISATRASFLVQATLLLTPLLSAAAGYRPSRNTWVGCGVALAGCLLITADEAAADVASSGWDAAGMTLGE